MSRYLSIFTVIVACLNMRPCAARPHDNDVMNLLSANGLAESIAGNTKFILPTVLTDGMIIIIKGILDTNHKTFAAKLTSNNPESTGPDCEFVYDFATNILDIMPASSLDHKPQTYTVVMEVEKEATFELRLKARNIGENPIINFNFERGQNGPSAPLACKIASLTYIDHIIMNGVERVQNLTFEFPK